MNRDYPLHIHISTLFLVVIVIIGGLIGFIMTAVMMTITSLNASI